MTLKSGRILHSRPTNALGAFLLGAFALALSLGLSSCRGSAKTAASSPASSPTPQAQVPQPPAMTPRVPARPTPEPPPPSMDAMAPVKTFQIQLPAEFASDQLPQDAAVEFDFTGRAGQMLRVRTGQPYRVLIQPPGDGSPLKPGWDSAGNWLYGLPETGTYRVLYAPWKTTPGIRFAFLPDNDPMLDPGVKAEEVSVDFGTFARKEELIIAPFDLNEDSEDYWESWPTHLAVTHDDFEFRVMTVAGNKKVFKKYERMTSLKAAIQGQGKTADVKRLPYPVYRGGGLNLWTRPRFVEGDGWRGLHWIAGFAQDIGCGPDMGGQELGYYFEGLSNDDRYFVLLRAHLSSPALAQRFGKDCEAEANDRDAGLNAVFQKDMLDADPTSFRPNLDQLDAVIRSLKLKQ